MLSSGPIPTSSDGGLRSSSSTPPPQPQPQPLRQRPANTPPSIATAGKAMKANSSRPHTSSATSKHPVQAVLPVEACSQVLSVMFDHSLNASSASTSAAATDRAMTVAGVVDARIYTPQSTNAQPMLLIRLGPMSTHSDFASLAAHGPVPSHSNAGQEAAASVVVVVRASHFPALFGSISPSSSMLSAHLPLLQPILIANLLPKGPCSQLPIPRLQSTRSTRMFTNPDIIMRKLNQAALASGQSSRPLAVPAAVSIGGVHEMQSSQEAMASARSRVIAHVGPPAYGASDTASQGRHSESAQLPLVSFKGTVTKCLSRALGIYELDQQILLVTYHAVTASDPPSVPAICKAFNVHVWTLDPTRLAPSVCEVLGTSMTAPAFPICVACAYSTIEWESTSATAFATPPACDAVLAPVISELRQLWHHIPLPILLDFAALVLALAPSTLAPEPPVPPWLVSSNTAPPRFNTHLIQRLYLQLVRPSHADRFAGLKVFTRRLWASEFVEHPAHCSVLACDSVLPVFSEPTFVVGRVVALAPSMLGMQLSGSSSVPVPLVVYEPVCPSVMGHVVCLSFAKRLASTDGGGSTVAVEVPRRTVATATVGAAVVPIRPALDYTVGHGRAEWWIVQLLAPDSYDGNDGCLRFRGRGNQVPGPDADKPVSDSLILSFHVEVLLTARNHHLQIDWSPTLNVGETYFIHCHRQSPSIPSNTHISSVLCNPFSILPINNPSTIWSLYLSTSSQPSWPPVLSSIPPPPPLASLTRTPLSFILDAPPGPHPPSRLTVAGTIRSLWRDRHTNHLHINLLDADDQFNCISLVVTHPPLLFPLPYPAVEATGTRLVAWNVAQRSSHVLIATPELASRIQVADTCAGHVQLWFPSQSPAPLPPPPPSTVIPTDLPLDSAPRPTTVPAPNFSTSTYWKLDALATADTLDRPVFRLPVVLLAQLGPRAIAQVVARVHQVRGSITLDRPAGAGDGDRVRLANPVTLVLADASTSVVATCDEWRVVSKLVAVDATPVDDVGEGGTVVVVSVQRQAPGRDVGPGAGAGARASYDPYVEYALAVNRVRPDSNEVKVVDAVRVGGAGGVAGVLAWSVLEALEQGRDGEEEEAVVDV